MIDSNDDETTYLKYKDSQLTKEHVTYDEDCEEIDCIETKIPLELVLNKIPWVDNPEENKYPYSQF